MNHALKQTQKPATIQGNFKKKGSIMSGDVNTILSRLDRFEDKLDDMNKNLASGAREFGGIDAVMKEQEKRIKSLETKIWAVVWLCVVSVLGMLFKAILT